MSYDFFVQHNAELIQIEPSSFVLQPEEIKEVTVNVTLNNSDIRQTDLIIISRKTINTMFYENETTYISINIEIGTSTQKTNNVNIAGLYGLAGTNYFIFLA